MSRMKLKIGSKVYPEGFEFVPGGGYPMFDIAHHIDDLALVYFDDCQDLVLHIFVPDGTAKKEFINYKPENKLYRYGKSDYVREAYETGHFFVSPALEFIKKEYDAARKDIEVIHTRNIAPNKVKITLAKDNSVIKPVGDIAYSTFHLPIDSYILCFSYDYDDNLYSKFEADSCLVINDVFQFTDRVFDAFKRLMPQYLGLNGRVTYSKHLSTLGVLFSKSSKYLYQREYRFVWIPMHPKRTLNPTQITQILNGDIDDIKKIIPKPVQIDIRSLKDICNRAVPVLACHA